MPAAEGRSAGALLRQRRYRSTTSCGHSWGTLRTQCMLRYLSVLYDLGIRYPWLQHSATPGPAASRGRPACA